MSKKKSKTKIVSDERKGPTTSRGEERRKTLLHTAAQLFMERGFNDVSINEIVRVAGGSLATVYEWFGGKEGLYYAVFKERMEEVSCLFQEFPVSGRGPEKDFAALLERVYLLQPYRLVQPALLEGINITDLCQDLMTILETKINAPLAQWFEKVSDRYDIHYAVPTRDLVLIFVRIFRGAMLELMFDSENLQKRQKQMRDLTRKVLVMMIVPNEKEDDSNKTSKQRGRKSTGNEKR